MATCLLKNLQTPDYSRYTSVGKNSTVATDSPYATQAAMNVLKYGGNAIDAAITAAAMLNLTYPGGGGLGGGGFCTIYLSEKNKIYSLDFRETAPSSITSESFDNLDPITLAQSSLSVGILGTLAGWLTLNSRFGTIELKTLFSPAIYLASNGFKADPSYIRSLGTNIDKLRMYSSTRDLLLNPETLELPSIGDRIYNKDLANTLKLIGRRGANAFYDGAITYDIINAINNPPVINPDIVNYSGVVTIKDFNNYKSIFRCPITFKYKDYKIYSAPPPSSGGIVLAETFNILSNYELDNMSRGDAYHLFLQSINLSCADRNKYIADPKYAEVPTKTLISLPYAKRRSKLIREVDTIYQPGHIFSYADKIAKGNIRENTSTTNITIIDQQGNIIVYTFTLGFLGGSGIVVPNRGFLLNNELTDFDNSEINRPEPGKRPRSSITPTIVLKSAKPYLALGGAGGRYITMVILNALFKIFEYRYDWPSSINTLILYTFNDELLDEQNNKITYYRYTGDVYNILETLKHRQYNLLELIPSIHSINGLEIVNNIQQGSIQFDRTGSVLSI